MKKGFWNGEPATFTVVEYEVTKSEEPLYWNNLNVGTRRQAIQIKQDEWIWLIDNQFGDGYYKVTAGKGMWTSAHKSITGPINVIYVPENKWITKIDHVGMKKENDAYEEWQKANHPDDYNRLQSLKKVIMSQQRKYRNG